MKWISVKDRLPPESRLIITLERFNPNAIPADDEISGAYYIEGKFFYDSFPDYPCELVNVTHWMMFEPPKEQD